jgi:ankyrin repeat protein
MLDKNGESAVVHAVRNKHTDFAETLLELDAFANAKDFSGSPALLMAWRDLQSGRTYTRSELVEVNKQITAIVRVFFAHGADPNVQQAHDGLTGLHLSIRFNQPNIALVRIHPSKIEKVAMLPILLLPTAEKTWPMYC